MAFSVKITGPDKKVEQKDSDDDSDLDIIDVDLSIDVNKMEASQVCVCKLYFLCMI